MESHDQSSETNKIIMSNELIVIYITKFKYFASIINFLLNDVEDAKCRIIKASKPLGASKFAWDKKYVTLETNKIIIINYIKFIDMGKKELN